MHNGIEQMWRRMMLLVLLLMLLLLMLLLLMLLLQTVKYRLCHICSHVPHSCCNAGGSLGTRSHVFSSHSALLLLVVTAIALVLVLVSNNINCQVSSIQDGARSRCYRNTERDAQHVPVSITTPTARAATAI